VKLYLKEKAQGNGAIQEKQESDLSSPQEMNGHSNGDEEEKVSMVERVREYGKLMVERNSHFCSRQQIFLFRQLL